MSTRRRSLHARAHAAVFVVGSVAALALTSGCGAPPDEKTGETGEAISFPMPKDSLDYITTETGSATPDGVVCGSYRSVVPAELGADGCTFGVTFTGDPKFPGTSYVWACPSWASPPSTGFGLQSLVPGSGWSEYAVVVTNHSNSCFGLPDPGWTIVIDGASGPPIGNGGCRGPACDGIGAQ